MNRDGFEFDLITQRFLKNRWETERGQIVYKDVIEGIKSGVDVRAVLDPYVLDHPENQDPYGHPYYPKDVMTEGAFWVLTQDDLRGIHIYNDEFPGNSSLSAKSLNYASFCNCSFNGANLERTSLTNVVFEKCNLEDTCFAGGGGYSARFKECNLKNICFWETGLIEADFSGSNLSGAYFESANLAGISVSYLSIFDRELKAVWETRSMPENQKPELLKAIRVAYEKAELWPLADQYLYLERRKNRKTLLWHDLKKNKNLSYFWVWLTDWFWGTSTGYGLKPSRILGVGLLVPVTFTFIFYFVGNPGNNSEFVTSLYYSLTTFATLGYGDLHYTEAQWVMRLISTFEALSGAVLIAVFVAVMARKVLRH